MPPKNANLSSSRQQGYIRLGNFVEKILDGQGYRCVEKQDFDNFQHIGVPTYTRKHINGPGVFGTGYEISFTIFDPISNPKFFCIQCRWQGVSGSTDRKLVFDIESIKIGSYETVILIGGPQLKPEVEAWLQASVGKNKLNRVLRPREFFYDTRNGRVANLTNPKNHFSYIYELKEILFKLWIFLKAKYR